MTTDADLTGPDPSGRDDDAPVSSVGELPRTPPATGTRATPPHGDTLTSPLETPVLAPEDRRSSGARAFVDWIVVVAVALTVAFLVRGFVLAHFVVDGSSMDSTLATGDRVFVNKLAYRLHDPNRGDVVVLHQISGALERDLIKRVIALPGETIQMTDCVVEVDGRVLVEPYLDPTVISSTCGGDFDPVTVPEEHVFVMGDNRSGSQDSRELGPISYDDLVGRAFVVFWPQSSWQWL